MEEGYAKNDALSKVKFVTKYNNDMFDLDDADDNTFYLSKEEIAWI